jgi:hypothetical protein
MTRPEYTLDYVAEAVLPEEQSWDASVALGKHIAQVMETDGISGDNRHYWLEDTQDIICGVSEQPDLAGEIEVVLHRGEGTWNLGLPRTYKEMIMMPKRAGQYIGFHVGHAATAATLMQVVMPLNKGTSRLLRHGSTTSFSFTPPQQEIMKRYDAGDSMLNPRRVHVAAQIMRRIENEQIVGRSSGFKTNEAEEAFLDKYFPFQDLLITGGGGKTVRKRAARPLDND